MRLSFGSLFRDEEEKRRMDFFAKNFSPISETCPDDVFIVGYPKSGTTWFQNIVAGLVFGFQTQKVPRGLLGELVPDVHAKPVYRRYQTPTFFRSHHKPRPEYRNVVYLLRDGRDVMVSYWHFRCALERKQIDFLKMIEDPHLFPCRWHEHVTEWMANPHQARMMVIKYEDLLVNPICEIERFCTFSGLAYDQSFIKAVAEDTSFKKLQTREQTLGKNHPVWPEDKPFFRRGIVGSFRDEMPPEVLTAFLRRAQPTLKKHHYV